MTLAYLSIWDSGIQPRPWRVQMKNYVAQFETGDQAQRYVATLKKIEEQTRRRT